MLRSYLSYSDEELLEMLRSGNDTAFTEIYARYWDVMFSIAARKLENPDDAKEIIQDIFISIWNRRTELKINYSLKTYLAAAVKLRVYSHLSKEHRYKAQKNTFSPELFISPEIENRLSLDELMQKVEIATATLPERCRLVFKLSRGEDLSNKEIAEKLSISERTVESQIHRALKTLKASLRTLLFNFFF